MSLTINREWNGALQPIGTLQDNGTFSYDADYLASADARAISFSLPLRTEPYGEAESSCYFKGLLPEGKALAKLAARLGLSENDYLGLLRECGLDCIGDVIINPEAHQEERAYVKTDIGELKRLFSNRPADSRTRERALSVSRLSLAGTQDKIGLYIGNRNNNRTVPHKNEASSDLSDDGNWFLPEGGAPSNFIMKVADSEILPDLMVVEQLGMACARTCGIDAAETELVPIDRGAIIVRRFDRLEPSEESIDELPVPLRRHQEDCAQALGLTPGSKYAELSGGTVRMIAGFLRAHSASPAIDLRKLLEITVFNYALGNTDNHLKNLSLLYSRDWKTIRLAPAYDLVPTTYYTRFSRQLSMAIGSTRNIDDVTPEDFRSLAEQIGVSQRMLRKTMQKISGQIVPALRIEAKRLNERGFSDAPYIADDLEEEIQPRLRLLESI